jgi:hypothetical protein
VRRFLIIAALLFPALAHAQGGIPASPIVILSSTGRPIGGATVTVCTNAGTGIPCTPLASIFTDVGLTTPWAAPPVSTVEVPWGFASPTQTTLSSSQATCATANNIQCLSTVFVNAHTIVRLTFVLATSPAGCTTSPQIGVRDETANTVLTSLTVTNGLGTGFIDSGALSIATTAGDRLSLGIVTVGAGCTTNAVEENLTAVLK